MKIISGKFKGRKINGYDIVGTRPTMDRVKESLMASIFSDINNSIVLDLFAGSGNLGLEAISNGSRYSYFVDNNQKCCTVIKNNISAFGIEDEGCVLCMDYRRALDYFGEHGICFDIIFVDPPYEMECINEVYFKVMEYGLLRQDGILVLEYRSDKFQIDDMKLLKKKKYGDKFVSIYRKVID